MALTGFVGLTLLWRFRIPEPPLVRGARSCGSSSSA
jgi:hypothetical protein